MDIILIELFTHNKENFDTNIKKLDTYIDLNTITPHIKQNLDFYVYDNTNLLNNLLQKVIIARNSYNISLLLSNRLSKCMSHTCWLPSELWNIIGNFLKMDLINKIKIYKSYIPITLTIKNNITIGNYDYGIIYKFNENGTIYKDIKVIT